MLVFDVVRDLDLSVDAKLKPRWLGPFKVVERLNNGSYKLAELDGAVRAGIFAPRRLKMFYKDKDD